MIYPNLLEVWRAARQRRLGLFTGLLLVSLAGCGKQAQSDQIESRRPERMIRRPVVARRELAESPAKSATEFVQTEATAADSEVGDGLIYRNDRIGAGPWSINLLKIDRSRKEFSLTTSIGRGRVMGLGPLSEQLEAIPADVGQPVAAINGDFYRTEQESYPGDPRGLQIARGELISAPNGKTAFWVDGDGVPNIGNVTPRFLVTWPNGDTTAFGLNEERHANDAIVYTPRAGNSTRTGGGRELILTAADQGSWLPLQPGHTYTAQVREVRSSGNSRLRNDLLVLSIGPLLLDRIPEVRVGDRIKLSTETSPDLNGVQVAVGGGPVLVHNGKVQPANASKSRERHPRSAFGWNDRYYFFVEVDGRQHGFSVGMSLPELASYLVKQGCQEAMNLDGGGSAEMWVEGQVVNRPCFGYERNTANGLVMVRKAKTGEKVAGAAGQ